MGVKHIKKKNDYPKVKKELEVLNGTGVEVGVLKGEHAWLAGIHEYGCNIPVTPKLRAFMHYNGIHLKKSTTQIIIPERSFLRAGYDQSRAETLQHATKMLADVATGKMSARGCYQAVGLELSSKIKDYAVALQSPPKVGFPLGSGSTNPLVDTGDMIGGITWRISG